MARSTWTRDTGIGDPRQAGVAEVVTTQMLVAELSDDLVPVGGVPQHRRGDPAAAWTREDPSRVVMADRVQPRLNERADFFNERDSAGPLAFRSLVDEPARAWCGLPPNRPGPGLAVNVGAPDAGHFADPGRGAGGEEDDVAPAFEMVGRPGDERGGQVIERLPIGQRQ